MRIPLPASALALALSLPSAALELSVDTRVADDVIGSLEAGGLLPAALFALEESEHVQLVVDDAVAMGLPAHVNGFLDALDATAAGDALRVDLFRFAEARDALPAVQAAYQRVVADPGSLVPAIEAALAPYGGAPESMILVPVAGAAACAGALTLKGPRTRCSTPATSAEQ